jgi:hypothetical protein
MEQLDRKIVLHAGDTRISSIIQDCKESRTEYTTHYSHTEDFFIRLPETVTVPSFAVHHDVTVTQPDRKYSDRMCRFMEQCAEVCPGVFSELYYFFDPAEILRPIFCRLYSYGGNRYLYMMRPDLSFRPLYHTAVQNGTNTFTPEYTTDVLFLDCDLIPIQEIFENENNLRAVQIQQSLSQTWIGETGRGYIVQGIWIDRDVTRFFSKLLTPEGVRTYPYYPVTCRYRAITHTVIRLEKHEREKVPRLLREAERYLAPHLLEIQNALKEQEFSETLPAYRRIKPAFPVFDHDLWSRVRVTAYLNQNDMKEYRLE